MELWCVSNYLSYKLYCLLVNISVSFVNYKKCIIFIPPSYIEQIDLKNANISLVV